MLVADTDRMNISGNTIFVPGATSGIGLALAVALRAKGNTVVIGGRRAELLERIAGEHPDWTPYLSTPPTPPVSRRPPNTYWPTTRTSMS